MSISGDKAISAQLKAMGAAPGGAALRAAAMSAMVPALHAAQAAAPIADPPYHYGTGVKTVDGVSQYGVGTVRTVQPYPKKTYLGRLVTPGFASRNVARKATLSRDKTFVKVMVGVRPEAFYAVQFIELGTSKIPKRPWLEPSFRASRAAVDLKFQELLKALIDKAATKK